MPERQNELSSEVMVPQDVQERVEELRRKVLDNDKLKNFRTEDRYLLRFLHCCDFDVPLAFKKLEDHCSFIIQNPDWFSTESPLDKKEEIEKNDKAMLLDRDIGGRAILVLQLGKMDAVNSCPMEQSQLFDMWLESIMDDPQTQAAGLSVIVDMKGFSLRLFGWLTPSNIKLIVKKIDVYPFKELLLHVVNTNFLLSAVIKLIWPFLTERLKNMFKFHFDDWTALHKYVSPDVLPLEYGGTGPDIDFEKSSLALFERNNEIGARLKYQKVNK